MDLTYQVMPDLADDEYEALKADIAARGVMVPIEFDENGKILDGHHRLRACEELGITDYPRVIRAGMTEEEKRLHARQLNLARRQLTREQRRDLIREQLKETPELSDRQIADKFGVSNKTVGSQRRELEEANEIPTITARVGADGRVQQRRPVSVFNPTKREVNALKRPEVVERAIQNGDNDAIMAEKQLKREAKRELTEDNYDPSSAAPTAQTIELGDIYQLGRHRLMCGDSTSPTDIALLMDGAKADFILSDPPYGMKLKADFSHYDRINGGVPTGNVYEDVRGDGDDFTPALIETFFENFGYCKEIFLFGPDYYFELIPDFKKGAILVWDKRLTTGIEQFGSEFELIWSKAHHSRKILRHIWSGCMANGSDSKDAQNRVHPTQKPVSLLADILEQWGKKATNIVDLYGGSGSTLIAGEQLDKTVYMMEIVPYYVNIIIDRWEKLTGQKAVKIRKGTLPMENTNTAALTKNVE